MAHHPRRATRTAFRPVAEVAIATLAIVAVVAVGIALASPSGTTRASDTASPATSSPSASPTPPPSAEPSPEPSPEPELPRRFTFVAAGDVLLHAPVLSSAKTNDGYNFSPLMANLRPYVDGADLAICHLEVPVAPPGTAYTGYPRFGGPAEIVRDLRAEGWNGCSLASNHSVDRGMAGIVTTLETFDEYRMGHSGVSRTEEEAGRVQFYNVRHGSQTLRVANISLTYGLNGLPLPQGAPWAVDLFDADASDAQPIIDAAWEAREQGADIVIASVHCCVEYRVAPTQAQRRLVEKVAASGAVDLYVGHHGHVPQPIELLPGGPYGDGMWAAYGLGNYLSNQDTQCCVALTNSGVILTATFEISPDGIVTVAPEWTAITVDRLNKHTMHALHEISGGHGRISANEAKARLQRVADAVGTQAPQRTEPPQKLADAAYRTWRTPFSLRVGDE